MGFKLFEYRLGEFRLQDGLATSSVLLVLIQHVVGQHLVETADVAVVMQETLHDPGRAFDFRQGLQSLLHFGAALSQVAHRLGLGGNGRQLKQSPKSHPVLHHEHLLVRRVAGVRQQGRKRRRTPCHAPAICHGEQMLLGHRVLQAQHGHELVHHAHWRASRAIRLLRRSSATSPGIAYSARSYIGKTVT